MMWQLSDAPRHEDSLSAMRRLLDVQRKALAGDPDDVYCVETQPF
jgi:hypothetical protein